MTPGWKRWLLTGVRVVLGGALLVLAFRQIDWAQIGPTLAGASPAWLLLGLLSVLLSLWLRIWRWQYLLANYHVPVSLKNVAGAYLVGQAANILMPVRTGEILRFGWLRARHPEGSVAMVASIAIEKYLDLGMLLLFFVAIMPYLPVKVLEDNLNILIITSSLLTVLIGIGAISGPRIGLWLSGAAKQHFTWAAALDPLVRWLADSAWMQSPRRFLPALGLSLASWAVMTLTNLLVMLAVGLPWNPRAAVLVLVLVFVGSAPALVPGNVGPFHFFSMLALSLLGISGAKSAAFALFLHALVTLPPLLLSAAVVLVSERFPKKGGLHSHES